MGQALHHGFCNISENFGRFYRRFLASRLTLVMLAEPRWGIARSKRGSTDEPEGAGEAVQTIRCGDVLDKR